MKRIDRHIQKFVLTSIAVVVVLTASVDLVFMLADELSGTATNYLAPQALMYVLQIMPRDIYELLPFSALGGALIGLGILASNNELVVIQAAGVKTSRIVWAAMKPTLLIMVASLVVGEYVAPQLEQRAQSNKAVLLSGGNTISPYLGTWQKIGNEFIHINAIAPGGESLFGVTRYRLDDNRQLVANSFAETARYIADDGQGYWQLSNVVETLIGTQKITTGQYLQLDWIVDLPPELLSVLLVDPQRQSISNLYRFASYFENEGLEANSYFLGFWKKLLQPLATAALVLLAISFVFGPLRDSTMGFRLFIAISIGLIFTIVQELVEPASLLYGFSPLIAVLTPIVICAVLGGYLLQRVR